MCLQEASHRLRVTCQSVDRLGELGHGDRTVQGGDMGLPWLWELDGHDPCKGAWERSVWLWEETVLGCQWDV